jgi:hypothetical protein
MDEACNMHRKGETHTKFFFVHLNIIDILEDLDLDGSKILERI